VRSLSDPALVVQRRVLGLSEPPDVCCRLRHELVGERIEEEVPDEVPLAIADDDELHAPLPRGFEDRVGPLPRRLDGFGGECLGLQASRGVFQQMAMPFFFDRAGVARVGSSGVQRGVIVLDRAAIGEARGRAGIDG
jgi:hypothetical protein